jgi:hypothetical protein
VSQVRRGLTPGEIALAREAFGERVPLEQVTFVEGAGRNPVAKAAFRNGNSAITLRRTIYFGPAYYQPDFSAGKSAAKGLLIHELAHVWQYEKMGTAWFFARYGREYAAAGFKAWRMYEYEIGKTPFRRAMLEAQAEMTGNYAEAKADGDVAKMALVAQNLAGSGFFGL